MRAQVEASHRIEPLDSHNRDLFSCGVDSLDRYLQHQAKQDAKRRDAAPFVLVEPPQNVVLGYYTLSAGGVDIGDWPEELAKKLPRYPSIPVTLLGRLAVDENHRRKGLGDFLIMDALYKSLQASKSIASVAVIVDPLGEYAENFYRHYDFQPFPLRPSRMLLPMKTIEKLF